MSKWLLHIMSNCFSVSNINCFTRLIEEARCTQSVNTGQSQRLYSSVGQVLSWRKKILSLIVSNSFVATTLLCPQNFIELQVCCQLFDTLTAGGVECNYMIGNICIWSLLCKFQVFDIKTLAALIRLRVLMLLQCC